MEPDTTSERVLGVNGAMSVTRSPVAVPPPLAVSDDHGDDSDADVAVAGDAFTAFYRTHRDRLARALARTVRDGHLAAEAVDEAMARAYQRWARVEAYDDPAAWVYRVALNWSTSVIRRRLRPQRIQHVPDVDGVGDSITEPTVLAALAALDIDQRAVIVCRYYLGLSEAETAAALRIRPGTAKSRLHRGLRILESRLSHLRPEASE